jgi:YesN/AraC family two-component response regulator
LGEGSSFYVQIRSKQLSVTSFELPIITEQNKLNTQNKPIEIKKKQQETANGQQENTILLVEDNIDLRAYIKTLLTPYYNVITAENGQEALERLTVDDRRLTADNNRQAKRPSTVYRPPSLIISDVMMPVMDGFEFLEKVKAHPQWRQIPFIMLTARAEIQTKLKALRIGVDDYLLKPFEEEELLVRIENLLNNYELREEYRQSDISNKNANDTPANISDRDAAWLRKLEDTVKKEMNNSLFGNDYLAEQLNINRNTLYHKIKSLTGLTPNQYVRTIRLRVAKELLESGQIKTLTEITTKVGFQKNDYFSKIFKKEFGKSPMTYIKY